jgi:hypothetical protein
MGNPKDPGQQHATAFTNTLQPGRPEPSALESPDHRPLEIQHFHTSNGEAAGCEHVEHIVPLFFQHLNYSKNI